MKKTFNHGKASAALAPLWRKQGRSAPEFSALQEAAYAMLLPFVPPDSFYDDHGRIVASRDDLMRDMERGAAYVAYLAPWVEGVKARATVEQRQFLNEVGLDGGEASEGTSSGEEGEGEDEDDTDSNLPAPAESYPDPIDAVALLEALASQHNRSTVEHTAIELAVQTLRFFLDTGQGHTLRANLAAARQPLSPERLERLKNMAEMAK